MESFGGHSCLHTMLTVENAVSRLVRRYNISASAIPRRYPNGKSEGRAFNVDDPADGTSSELDDGLAECAYH